jgi:hypothetical protein
VLIERLRMRTNNPYGQNERELSQVLADLAEIEPMLRRSADLVLVTTESPARTAEDLLRRVAELSR